MDITNAGTLPAKPDNLRFNDLPPMSATRRPPWNGFDTILRRTVMLGAAILIWVTIAFGVIGASAIISAVHNAGKSDVGTTNIDDTGITSDESVVPPAGD
jgi:hypothetical protein